MKAAVCEEPRKIVIKNVEEPKLKDDEVLVKVKSAGISRSDVLAYMGMYPKVKYPIILGHEFSGEIATVGKKVADLDYGDEVIVEPLLSCGECDSCLSGNHNLCRSVSMLGFHIPGAYAEYVTVKASLVHRKDETMSFDEATLIGPLASSIHAIKQAGISIGDQVVILGAGGVGLIALQIAKLAGASVIIMDEDSERLHFAADLEADYVISPSSDDAKELIMAVTKDKGVSFIFESTGDPKNLVKAVDLVCKGGKIIMMELIENSLDLLPLNEIILNEITLMGSVTHCKDFPLAIELVNSGSVNVNSIVSLYYEFDEIPKAFEILSQKSNEIIKAMIKFDAEES
jgi:2-desacetyl-2-hydroxyethyl bacteriochlorophyllide A dehydrogenase